MSTYGRKLAPNMARVWNDKAVSFPVNANHSASSSTDLATLQAYPVIACMGFALYWAGYVSSKYLVSSPDVL
jgi:hypothetical protein